jgi:CRISPR-associated protein Csx17
MSAAEKPVSQTPDEIDWSLTTWEGSRRAQLRRALTLTVRERLEALAGMEEVAERFRQMRKLGLFKANASGTLRPDREAG